MTKQFKFPALCFTALAVVWVSSCSNEDDFFHPQEPSEGDTRGIIQDGYFLVNFEDNGLLTAGPTSYGANLYDGYVAVAGYPRFTSQVDPLTNLEYGVNPDGWGGSYNFWNGGVAVSAWNYRSNTEANDTSDWWYSYTNQCSVYNVASEDGTNAGAGRNGSDHFAVVFGYTDTYTGYVGTSGMAFTNNTERRFDRMYVCNSSYTYGVMENGNAFTQGSLKDNKGYFHMIARGYKAGSATPVASDTIALADFRNGKNILIDTWTEFDLVNIKKQTVNKIEFDFEGSDSGAYGLNTPAYACIDDIYIAPNE